MPISKTYTRQLRDPHALKRPKSLHTEAEPALPTTIHGTIMVVSSEHIRGVVGMRVKSAHGLHLRTEKDQAQSTR